MIWVAGKILPDDGLTINASDRTFEHGLGLFETMRTWGGRPTFLEAHRSRMLKSAEDLKIPIDPAHFPDEHAVAQLLEAKGDPDDQLLRITASGGSPGVGSVVWMRARSLDRSALKESFRIELGRWTIHRDDPLARHKSLNYWNRRIAREEAARRDFDETLGALTDGGYCEGSVSNVFVIKQGRWLTPSLAGPILPGLMRRYVIELAGDLAIDGQQVPCLDRGTIQTADEVFLTNSVLGIMPVAQAFDSLSCLTYHWPAPGPSTRRLQSILAERLGPGSHRP
jgi:branched-subunit amino acid aminotransferase/4-amino-4-deoxychorismate lyase